MSYEDCKYQMLVRFYPYLKVKILKDLTYMSLEQIFLYFSEKGIETKLTKVKPNIEYNYKYDMYKIYQFGNCNTIYSQEIAVCKSKSIDCKSTFKKINYVQYNETLSKELDELFFKLFPEDFVLNVECLCCFSETPLDNNISCTEGHLFCKTCIKTTITQDIFNPIDCRFNCMHTSKCDGFFRIDDVESCIKNEKLIKKLTLKTLTSELKKAEIEGTVSCRECETIFILEESDVLRCPNCKIRTCRLCGKEEHKGKTCEEWRIIEENGDAHKSERLKFEEAMTKALYAICPQCNKTIEKTDGCNRMTCCISFCYLCSEKTEGYKHFKGHGGKTCPLYEGKEEATNFAIQKAKEDILAANPDAAEKIEEVSKTLKDTSKTQKIKTGVFTNGIENQFNNIPVIEHIFNNLVYDIGGNPINIAPVGNPINGVPAINNEVHVFGARNRFEELQNKKHGQDGKKKVFRNKYQETLKFGYEAEYLKGLYNIDDPNNTTSTATANENTKLPADDFAGATAYNENAKLQADDFANENAKLPANGNADENAKLPGDDENLLVDNDEFIYEPELYDDYINPELDEDGFQKYDPALFA